MSAYYNEIDPFAAQVLRELIREGVIAPGVVDERDIRDVRPDELVGFTQCHFFAGGGVWSYALRKAGWRDEWPIWTGSCPCQPFSQAGKGLGFDDERHLWPAFDWLIQQCGPVVVAGEQVADKGADVWLDLVQADLEGMGYAFGCVPLASAGFGAPNPRHRTFWMAHSLSGGQPWVGWSGQAGIAEYCYADRLGDTMRHGAGSIGRDGDCPKGAANGNDRRVSRAGAAAGDAGAVGGLANARCLYDERRRGCGDTLCSAGSTEGEAQQWQWSGPDTRHSGAASGAAEQSRGDGIRDPGPTNGFWRDADWLYCRDPRGPRWRPVNRGTFPLAPGTPERVGTVRLSGNAINAEVAAAFAEAMIEVLSAKYADLAA